jgi:hypothetical protein
MRAVKLVNVAHVIQSINELSARRRSIRFVRHGPFQSAGHLASIIICLPRRNHLPIIPLRRRGGCL